MMATHDDGPTVDWGTVVDSILATSPWRLGAARPPQNMTEAAADPHEHDWAGPGFTRPGPEPDLGYQTGYPRGKAEAVAGMTTIFDEPATSFTDGHINGHCQMTEDLAREASSQEAEAVDERTDRPRPRSRCAESLAPASTRLSCSTRRGRDG
jgi:hypothetical protein